MMYEIRRQKPQFTDEKAKLEPTLLLTQGIFNLSHHRLHYMTHVYDPCTMMFTIIEQCILHDTYT